MRLDMRGLGVRYGAREALAEVDLAAQPGEVLAVLGANGSGKSSLLRALAGLVAHQGTILWNGGPAAPKGAVGFMPQDNALVAALSAFEVVLLGRMRSLALRVAAPDLQAAERALSELGLSELAARPIGELSGGQRQLVYLAQVLAGDPRVLLLDEPTSALDIAHQLDVLGLLRTATHRRGLTTIVVLHDLNLAARFADRVAVLAGGRLLGQGAPDILDRGLLRDGFGVEAAVLRAPDGRPVMVPLCRTPVGPA